MSDHNYRYYRADTEAVRRAWSAYRTECEAVTSEARAFASLFDGATPVFASGAHGRRFHGLAFNPPMPTDVWTHPDNTAGNVQRPRSRITAPASIGRADRVAAMREAAALYANAPSRRAVLDPVFDAIGTDWGTMLLCGYKIVERDGAIFIRTTTTLGAPCVEVTCSEYEDGIRPGVDRSSLT